jgi:hypothetical protein
MKRIYPSTASQHSFKLIKSEGVRQCDQIGRFFSYWAIFYFGSGSKNTEVVHFFWGGVYFFRGTSYVLILTKKLVGPHFGRLFTKNSSGHPGAR